MIDFAINAPTQPQELKSTIVEDDKQVNVNIDPKEKNVSNETIINFKQPSFIKDFVSQPTANQPAASENPVTGKQETVEEIRARMIKEEEDEASKLTVEDFEDIADFLMDLIDMGAIFLIRWYSGDNTDAPYNIPTEKLKRLKNRLAKLLMRVQAKFPLGLLFVLSLLMAYATPARKAHEYRKTKLAEKRNREQTLKNYHEKRALEKEKQKQKEEEIKRLKAAAEQGASRGRVEPIPINAIEVKDDMPVRKKGGNSK